jgi:hypothetical protein
MWCALVLALLPQLQLAPPIYRAPHHGLAATARLVAPPARLSMDSVFTNAISAAGFRVDNGKLAFTRNGRPLAATVGRSTFMPLVDFNFGGATAVMRFVF